jgi:hypothetical protein
MLAFQSPVALPREKLKIFTGSRLSSPDLDPHNIILYSFLSPFQLPLALPREKLKIFTGSRLSSIRP